MEHITPEELTEFFSRWQQQLRTETAAHEATAKAAPLTHTVRIANNKSIAALDMVVQWQREKSQAIIDSPESIDAI